VLAADKKIPRRLRRVLQAGGRWCRKEETSEKSCGRFAPAVRWLRNLSQFRGNMGNFSRGVESGQRFFARKGGFVR
jgi:hypothetical protein